MYRILRSSHDNAPYLRYSDAPVYELNEKILLAVLPAEIGMLGCAEVFYRRDVENIRAYVASEAREGFEKRQRSTE